MKSIHILITVLLLISFYGCSSPGNNHDTDNMKYLMDLGYEYAARYRALSSSAGEMERQDFLLDVQARETRIRNEIGTEYALKFHEAFADSAFTEP